MKFSIVIPTHDRPGLLAVAVRHAMQQQGVDFEVIVSDNSTSDDVKRRNAVAVQDYRGAPNFRVVTPPGVLSPPENFEFALQFARGDYVTYLTDKMVILPHALEQASAAISTSSSDIVNWAYAHYVIDDVSNPAGSGVLVEERAFLGARPETFDPIAALRFKAGGSVRRDNQGTKEFFLGKIVFGCFSRQLIERIRARSGTLFGGATHDYAAMVQALSLAKACVTLNRYAGVFIALPRDQSLGTLTATEPKRALQYYRSFANADSILASLLVPGVYASQHNMVAHDYRKFLPLYGNQHMFSELNWLFAVYEDLVQESKVWSDPAEKRSQLGQFCDHLGHTGWRTRVRFKLKRKRMGEWLRANYEKYSAPVRLRVKARLPPAPPAPPTAQTFAAGSLDEALSHVALSHAAPQTRQHAAIQ